MTNGLGVTIDGLVAILLMLTIIYCVRLNRRLELLKADEQSLRATISELVTATEIAERAIGGLKTTVHDCDTGLGERLRKGERVGIELDRSIAAGRELLARLSQIVIAGRGDAGAAAAVQDTRSESNGKAQAAVAPKTNAGALAAAAHAFTERLRSRVHGIAA